VWQSQQLEMPLPKHGGLNYWRAEKSSPFFYEVRMLKLYAVSDEYIRYLRVENNIIHVFDNKEGHRTHDCASMSAWSSR